MLCWNAKQISLPATCVPTLYFVITDEWIIIRSTIEFQWWLMCACIELLISSTCLCGSFCLCDTLWALHLHVHVQQLGSLASPYHSHICHGHTDDHWLSTEKIISSFILTVHCWEFNIKNSERHWLGDIPVAPVDAFHR